MLGIPLKEGMAHVDWEQDCRFKQNYLWKKYSGFMEEMKTRKECLSSEEWKAFCEKHPDFIRLYEKKLQKRETDPNENDLSTCVFGRYHFK